MDYYGYALCPAFYTYIAAHPSLLSELNHIKEEQRYHLIYPFDCEELWKRAVSYFDDTQMELREQALFYENSLKKTVYTMKIEPYRLIVNQAADNPFIPFLQRIYRTLYLCKASEVEVKKEKVL